MVQVDESKRASRLLSNVHHCRTQVDGSSGSQERTEAMSDDSRWNAGAKNYAANVRAIAAALGGVRVQVESKRVRKLIGGVRDAIEKRQWLHDMPWKLSELVGMELRAWQDSQLALQRAGYLRRLGGSVDFLA
jgi:hypothetical protein